MTSRLVVVTGASQGIGRATALQLSARGHRLVVVARQADKLESLAQEIRAARADAVVEVLPVDGGDGVAVKRAAADVVARLGTPWAVVHCAGAGRWLFCEDTEPAELAQMMAAPFGSAFHWNHALLPAMQAARAGVLIHVQSPVSVVPWPGATGYACARYALRGLHEALSVDLRGTGVTSSLALFGEVGSSYFTNNPGAHERLPALAKVLPTLSPEQCAEVLVRAVETPRARWTRPWVLTSLEWLAQLSPGFMAWLVASGSPVLPRSKPH